jgi:hypothetical protein
MLDYSILATAVRCRVGVCLGGAPPAQYGEDGQRRPAGRAAYLHAEMPPA